MSQLVHNCPPAERARGCVFAETFESQARVEANGGAVVGSPTVSFGAILDGTNDYLSYDLSDESFESDRISFVVEFNPGFDWNENAVRSIMGTDNGGSNRYAIIKQNNASNNVIMIRINGVWLANIAAATYSPYWRQNRRNVLVVSGQSTANDWNAWLNGVQIKTSDATVTSFGHPITLNIGADSTGAQRFLGTIFSFKVFHSTITAQEATDFYNQSTYEYMKDHNVICEYPMGIAQHDATNLRTLDVGPNGLHMSFGTGAQAPTKLSKRGYLFDGANPNGDYMVNTSVLDMFNHSEISFILMLKPDFESDADEQRVFYDTTAGDQFMAYKDNNAFSNVLRLCFNGNYISSIPHATWGPVWRVGQPNVFIVSGTSGNNNVWLNGAVLSSADSTAWTAANPSALFLGISRYYSLAARFDGDILYFAVLNKTLTDLQALDITQHLLKQVNHA